ncbi:MAG: hypothetical protein H8E27_01590 [Verrucomicrobia subdivision 3 bacterium]|nr:hypothetical protein [Limisphaerales bacterium]
MADVATKEPAKLRAGDTLKWDKTLDDYPANDSWVLKYAFRGNAGTFDITAGSSGADHSVSVSPTTTTGYAAGIYDVLGFVEKGTDRYTVYTGRIEILPDLETAGSSYDGRTHVKKTLDAIEATLENRAGKEILESTIEGVAIKRIPHEELIAMRSKYFGWYQQELAADRIAQGVGTGRTILTRFQ